MTDKPVKDPANPHGPVKVRGLTIKVEKDLCIGAATCAAIAPHTFELDKDAKAVVLQSADLDTDEAIIDAARGCPVAAILIENEKGEKIFPK
jgi:ferredoxin